MPGIVSIRRSRNPTLNQTDSCRLAPIQRGNMYLARATSMPLDPCIDLYSVRTLYVAHGGYSAPTTELTITAASRSQFPTATPPSVRPFSTIPVANGSCDPRSTLSLISLRSRSRFDRSVRPATPPRCRISCTRPASDDAKDRQKYDGRDGVSSEARSGWRRLEFFLSDVDFLSLLLSSASSPSSGVSSNGCDGGLVWMGRGAGMC